MIETVVLLSGPVSAGKSTLAQSLRERYQCEVIRTRDLIRASLPDTLDERRAMQEAGERLDRKDKGEWVAQGLAKLTACLLGKSTVIVDSVRVREQVRAVRIAYGPRVVLVHLTASEPV